MLNVIRKNAELTPSKCYANLHGTGNAMLHAYMRANVCNNFNSELPVHRLLACRVNPGNSQLVCYTTQPAQ